MARTPIAAANILTLVTPQPVVVVAGAQDVPFADSDSALGNSVPCTGREYLLAHNNDVAGQTVTVDAASDKAGRDGTLTAYSLAADAVAIFGPFPTAYYRQTDGTLHIDTSDDNVRLAVVRVP